MDAIKHFTQPSLKQNAPELRAGDTVRVHQKIREGNKERIQVFEGLVMAVRGGKGINGTFVVRRIASNGIGVEKTFPLHSPNVEKVERLKSSKVRQARLFYMRDRFGRMARMKGEVRNAGDWAETKAEAALESTEEALPSDEPEAVEEIPAEEVTPEETASEPEVAAETPHEKPDTETESDAANESA